MDANMNANGWRTELRPPPTKALCALVWLLCAALYALAGRGVSASGDVVTVYLGYVPEVSNWGNYEAAGRAETDVAQGTVRLEVTGLPTEPPVRYEVWLVPAEEADVYLSMGTFAVDSTGCAQVELRRARLPLVEYRLLVITAEPVPDPDPAPDERRALSGVFPNASAIAEGPSQTGLLRGLSDAERGKTTAPSEPQTRPAATAQRPPLPVTGEPIPRTVAYGALALAAIFGLLSMRLGARQVRRHGNREEER